MSLPASISLFQKDKVDHVTLIDNLENLFLQMLQRIVLADHFFITNDLTFNLSTHKPSLACESYNYFHRTKYRLK